MTVYLCIYEHKYGTDHAVCATEFAAYALAATWAYEAIVDEDRFDGEQPELVKIAKEGKAKGWKPQEATEFFLEEYGRIEWADGPGQESITIRACEVLSEKDILKEDTTWETSKPETLELLKEEWVGDEQDGCYVKVFEQRNGQFRVEVIVDSETGSFVDTLTEEGDCSTMKEALEYGRNAAADWCINNEVSFDDFEEIDE